MSDKKKVLIVEDSKEFLEILRRAFDGQDFSLLDAMDGVEGLAVAERESPDLILIDIQLPNMDGITMAKKIKEKGIGSQMMFLTNLSDAEHVSEAIDVAGQSDYIVKSDIHLNDVVARVKEKLAT